MAESNEQRELSERESQLMDSLLQHSLGNQAAQDERRIKQLLENIRESESEPSHVAPRIETKRSEPMRWGRWVSIPLAAALVAAVIFVLQTSSSESRAHAAVQRSLRAEQVASAREYEITIETRMSSGRVRTNRITLFVERDRFVIRAVPRVGRGYVWMGGQGESRWIVPRLGPVVVGQQGLLPNWSRKRRVAETPFLKLTTILDRLQRAYDLELMPPASLPSIEGEQSMVTCEHIVGIRQSRAVDSIPETVELWADAQSDFARRIELKWDRPADEQGWLSATAELIATPDLAENFFDHDAHHAPDRVVVENASE